VAELVSNLKKSINFTDLYSECCRRQEMFACSMSYNVEVKGHLKDLQIHVGIMGEYTSKTAFVL